MIGSISRYWCQVDIANWHRHVFHLQHQQCHNNIEDDVTPVSLQYQNVHWDIRKFVWSSKISSISINVLIHAYGNIKILKGYFNSVCSLVVICTVCSLQLCRNFGLRPAADKNFKLRLTVEKMRAFAIFSKKQLRP